MKICHVNPGCGLEIPPKGWGAIEKIIWEFKINLEKLGHQVDIKFVNEIEKGQYDIVHCHVANLAHELYLKNIPYIFQLHDHHVLLNKTSSNYELNKLAIENSIISLLPSKELVKYFDNLKGIYFPHGVNIDKFQPFTGIDLSLEKVRNGFLMLANNGIGGNPGFDRKGFNYGVALASKLDIPITIAGPSNNKNFFNENPWVFSYDKLKLIFDPNEKEVLDLYQTHMIFLHPSNLEAGHPNLTLLEAAACGLPIIGWIEMETDFHGLWRSNRDIFLMEKGYRDIISNWDWYVKNSLETAKKLSWYNRSIELQAIYERFINRRV